MKLFMAASLAPAHTEYAQISGTYYSYTMCARDLTDIYTLSPQACGPRASGVAIYQSNPSHTWYNYYMYNYVTTNFEMQDLQCTTYS